MCQFGEWTCRLWERLGISGSRRPQQPLCRRSSGQLDRASCCRGWPPAEVDASLAGTGLHEGAFRKLTFCAEHLRCLDRMPSGNLAGSSLLFLVAVDSASQSIIECTDFFPERMLHPSPAGSGRTLPSWTGLIRVCRPSEATT